MKILASLKRLSAAVFVFCLAAMPMISPAATTPPLDGNSWNFIFVQSFEGDLGPNNNLAIEGFNHAHLFGQLLNTLTAGKSGAIRQIYAFDPSDGMASDMRVTESIEPFAVLNNLGIVHVLVNHGDASVYNSPAYILNQIVANQPGGIYIIAMPAAVINSTLQALDGSSNPPPSLAPGNSHQYAVWSLEQGKSGVAVYDDGLRPEKSYPALHIADGAQCPQNPVTIHVKTPKDGKFMLNAGQTIHFIRHVEAHPTGSFENGNFVCQGEWRAIGATEILRKKIGGLPDTVYTTNPNDIIGCNTQCSYVRPALTIAPFAIEHGKRLELAQFQWNDAPTLAAALFTQNSPYSSKEFDHSSVLVAWEHDHIVKAVSYLLETIYGDKEKAKLLPAWSYTDYDSIWTIKTDQHGDLTFTNSCEGIASETLPSTCPAFFGSKQ
ncbi:MAG TPA: hypothetical protein VIF60_01080 [Burkholderiaceae bacterium]|jgi:hypothetical protein